MKYIGAAYILWLAIHIAFSKKTSENTEQSASFLKGFMLQFVNVKIYMFGVTALTGYVVGYMSSFPALLFFELVIATIGTIATCTWIGLGVLIQKFYLRHFRVINIILALTFHYIWKQRINPIYENCAYDLYYIVACKNSKEQRLSFFISIVCYGI